MPMVLLPVLLFRTIDTTVQANIARSAREERLVVGLRPELQVRI